MVKPSIITTNKVLPFGELSPLEFERLCLWLVEREGFSSVQHLGESGSEQGRDIIAYKETEQRKELWYIQCKRYNRIDVTTLKKEVDKYNTLVASDNQKRPTGIIFITSASVSANIREKIEQYCHNFGYFCEFWARTELDMRTKKYPEIVTEFFAATRIPPVSALHQLPSSPTDFTGRKSDLNQLVKMIKQRGITICGIHGLGGVGKTTLAIKLAEKLLFQYQDAQFYIDLQGNSNPLLPSQIMSFIIQAYHPDIDIPKDVSALTALYRSVLHNQKGILLLDNARDAIQVEQLIPPLGWVLIVTSRQSMVFPGLFAKNLNVFSVKEACEFLLKIAPRIGNQAQEIANLCGRLPLALRLAGSALVERRDISPKVYVDRLLDANHRVKLIDASIELSYEILDRKLQKLWRSLAIFPESFDARAAAVIWDINEDETREVLSDLIKYSLVEWQESDKWYEIEFSYHLHDLARLYADSKLKDDERNEIKLRFITYYIDVVPKPDVNDYLNNPTEAVGKWLHQFTPNLSTINVAQQYKLKELEEQLATIKKDLKEREELAYQEFTNSYLDGNPFDAAGALYMIACVRYRLEDFEEAIRFAESAISLLEDIEQVDAAEVIREDLNQWIEESSQKQNEKVSE